MVFYLLYENGIACCRDVKEASLHHSTLGPSTVSFIYHTNHDKPGSKAAAFTLLTLSSLLTRSTTAAAPATRLHGLKLSTNGINTTTERSLRTILPGLGSGEISYPDICYHLSVHEISLVSGTRTVPSDVERASLTSVITFKKPQVYASRRISYTCSMQICETG